MVRLLLFLENDLSDSLAVLLLFMTYTNISLIHYASDLHV